MFLVFLICLCATVSSRRLLLLTFFPLFLSLRSWSVGKTYRTASVRTLPSVPAAEWTAAVAVEVAMTALHGRLSGLRDLCPEGRCRAIAAAAAPAAATRTSARMFRPSSVLRKALTIEDLRSLRGIFTPPTSWAP